MISTSELSESGNFIYTLFTGDIKDIAEFYKLPLKYLDFLRPLLDARNLVLHRYDFEKINQQDEVFFRNSASVENGELCHMIADTVIKTEEFLAVGDFSELPKKISEFVEKAIYTYLHIKKLSANNDDHYIMTVYLGTDTNYLAYSRKHAIDEILLDIQYKENF